MQTRRDGIILVDKREGKTSSDVVRQVKRALGVKKVGHAGTLDPFATGLLIILLGQGTKLSRYVMAGEKTYRARLGLGVETDTFDLTGHVVQTRAVPALAPDWVNQKALQFVGEIEQVPPAFSAVKYKGTRAYKLARKGIEFELPKRKVTVRSIAITSLELPDLTMEIICSSGTYIRSLASDLGRRLGTGAHLKALRRLASEPFPVEEAIELKGVDPGVPATKLAEKIVPLWRAVAHIQGAQIDARLARKIRGGYRPDWSELLGGRQRGGKQTGPMTLLNGNDLVAIVEIDRPNRDPSGRLKISRVFNERAN
jgi:tRNA pseudouridine55 synthase